MGGLAMGYKVSCPVCDAVLWTGAERERGMAVGREHVLYVHGHGEGASRLVGRPWCRCHQQPMRRRGAGWRCAVTPRAADRSYYAAHVDVRREYSRRFYAAHPDYKRSWETEHPDKMFDCY